MVPLRQSVTGLFKLFFPPACALCRKTLPAGWEEVWCPSCLAAVPGLPDAHCRLCLQPFAGESAFSHLCGRCQRTLPAFSSVYTAGLYDGSLKSAVQQFKFQQRVSLDRSLAILLNRALPESFDCDLIIPVPLHPATWSERCYNQAQLLAVELGRIRKLPVAKRLLSKTRQTLPQHNLSARQREQNLRGAFSVTRTIEHRQVLLVDDVMTTGATVAACSQVLLDGGADKVAVVTVARAA